MKMDKTERKKNGQNRKKKKKGQNKEKKTRQK